MPWNQAAAQKRIEELVQNAPEFEVQRFEQYRPLYEANRAVLAAQNKQASPPLFSLQKGKAVVVDTVQIYIAITNYDDYRLEEGRETEASHDKALRLLHLYYSAADRAIENSAAQRVDFHSGRVHAVVLENGNQGVTRETLAQALAFVEDFKRVAQAANEELAGSQFKLSFRIGVDVGTCVAINNGTGQEQEPMFLGSAANHAAKLADGAEPGVYVSERVRSIIGLSKEGIISDFIGLSDTEIATNAARLGGDGNLVFGFQDRQVYANKIVEDWRSEIHKGDFPDFTRPNFSFHYKAPPLKEIDYSELQPSRSIRMPLVSMYADLSGYTDYIDRAVSTGGIREAVQALYVVRHEFQNVVEKDFGGRKVRFIGDCIHAVLAEGSRTETDKRKSVASAALCAGGLHSSFKLCKEALKTIDELGLAVGIELGPTPISRIGIRGDRSVRVASSIATTRSEKMQRECEENGVKFGPEALSSAPAALEDILDGNGYKLTMDYRQVALCLSSPSELETPNYARAHVQNDHARPKAHLKV